MKCIENWPKRSRSGPGLTANEIESIGLDLRAGIPVRHTARRLNCSTRIITKYRAYLIADGTTAGRRDRRLRFMGA